MTNSQQTAVAVNNLRVDSAHRPKKSKKTIVEGATFSCSAGSIHGLIGINGSGKSTCLEAIVGRVPRSGGTVLLLNSEPDSPAWKGRVGYVPQDSGLYPYLTGKQLLQILSKLGKSREKHRNREIIEKAEHATGVVHFAEKSIGKLSGGEIQRLKLACALVQAPQPEVLILDEPLNALDILGREEVASLLKQLRENGTAILLTSHIANDVAALCDAISVVHEGRVLSSTSSAQALQAAETIDGYLKQCIRESMQ